MEQYGYVDTKIDKHANLPEVLASLKREKDRLEIHLSTVNKAIACIEKTDGLAELLQLMNRRG